MKVIWKTYKDKGTGFTIIEATCEGKTLHAALTPRTASKMTTEEFNRLIKRLGEAMELSL